MSESTKQSLNEAENGNKSKPMLCEVFLSEGWIDAETNPPKNNKNVIVKCFLAPNYDEDFEEQIAFFEDGEWKFINDSIYIKKVLFYYVYPSSF